MKLLSRGLVPLCLATLAGDFLAAQPLRAETLVSTNADNRLLVAFDVGDAALGQFMPDGWNSAPFGGGPYAGANQILVFIDSHRTVDPEGEPKYGGRYRGMAVAAPAKADGSDETAFMVTHVYVSDAKINPYRNSVGARVTRQVASTGTGGEAASTRQSWSVAPETGGVVALSLAWPAGVPGLSEGESNIRSVSIRSSSESTATNSMSIS